MVPHCGDLTPYLSRKFARLGILVCDLYLTYHTEHILIFLAHYCNNRISVCNCILPCADKTLYFQNFQNEFFCIIHISLSFSILCKKIFAENCLQNSFFGSIKTLYPIFRVGFDNQNTLSNVRFYNT